jgi:hypothetical protein
MSKVLARLDARESSDGWDLSFAEGLQLPDVGLRRDCVQRRNMDAAHRPRLDRPHPADPPQCSRRRCGHGAPVRAAGSLAALDWFRGRSQRPAKTSARHAPSVERHTVTSTTGSSARRNASARRRVFETTSGNGCTVEKGEIPFCRSMTRSTRARVQRDVRLRRHHRYGSRRTRIRDEEDLPAPR